MPWSSEDMRARAAKDFESAWMDTIKLISEGNFRRKGRGRAHPRAELIEKIRAAFLSDGYDEAVLPPFLDEGSLSRQTGPEAPMVSRDSYLLYEIPRKFPQLNEAHLEKMRRIAPSFNEQRLGELQSLLEQYSQNKFGSQSLCPLLVENTGVLMEQAAEILNIVFEGGAEPSKSGKLLRHGLAHSWFETLSALKEKEPLPLQLFSVGPSFRSGPGHSGFGYFASGAVLDESVSESDVETSVSRIFGMLGAGASLEKSVATSKLFIPGTEKFIYSKGIRAGRAGLVSPIALSEYGLEIPALIFEFSIERLGVALGLGSEDRAVLYPQFFGDWSMDDASISQMIRVGRRPSSWGRELANKITKTCDIYSQKAAPCEFKLMKREMQDHRIEVWLSSEKGSLCGKDYANQVYVHDGNVVSAPALPAGQLKKEAVKSGVKTGISLVGAFASLAAARIESNPLQSQKMHLGEVSDPSEANIVVPELVRRYISSNGKSLGVGGELNLTVENRVKRLWVHEQPR